MRGNLSASFRYRLLSFLLLAGMLLAMLPATNQISAAAVLPDAQAAQAKQVTPTDGSTRVELAPVYDLDNLPANTRVAVMVELYDEPAAVVYARAKEQDQRSSQTQLTSIVRNQVNRIQTAQQNVINQVARLGLKDTQVIYQLDKGFNGIAYLIDSASIPALRGLPGVKTVSRVPEHVPDNAGGISLIEAQKAWTSYGLTGTNIRVGIIDTGLDYYHTNFGGPGTAYTSTTSATFGVNTTVITDTPGLFPGSKVVGGWDFAGDGYTGSATPPVPDPDPLDCASPPNTGHGSHVAGTVGGFGVNANGTTFQGPYDTTVPTLTMGIGPGVAPGAKLYALRVFGCGGSTGLTALAIEWAMDPNDDNDFSDHLDVINMSLGSAFGSNYDSSATTSNNAALVGVIVVASAGNSGDTTFITGSPGSSTRTIATAAVFDRLDKVGGFRVNPPAANAGVKPASYSSLFGWPGSPTITAPVAYAGTISPTNQFGCNAFSPAEAALINGNILLVDWTTPGQDTGAGFPCGSGARANNAQAAGAVGIIMASGVDYFDTAIGGNAGIRAVYTIRSVATGIINALQTGPVMASMTYEYNGQIVVDLPAQVGFISSFTSRGPRNFDAMLKPDLAGPGQGIYSTASGSGNQGSNKNGTSMAAPHVAGMMALLRQQHANWSVEELKALAMNTTKNDIYTGPNQTGLKYSPLRVGTGVVNVPNAMANQVVAYNSDNPGAISLSYGSLEVAATTKFTKTLTIVNKGTSPVDYTASYVSYNDMPGADVSFPGGTTFQVVPNVTTTIQVVLTVDPALVRNPRDLTMAPLQGTPANQPRFYLADESGLVMLTPATGVTLRVALYALPRAASDMQAAQSTQYMYTGQVLTTSLGLTGIGVDHGSNTPTDTRSLVTAFELAGSSGVANLPGEDYATYGNADLKQVGVASDGRYRRLTNQPISTTQLYFALATHQPWAAPATEVTFNIYFDLDRNGTDDARLVTFRQTHVSPDLGDLFYTLWISPSTSTSGFLVGTINGFAPNVIDTRLFMNNVMIFPVPASRLNLPAGTTKFNYRVVSSNRNFATVDQMGPFTYDLANPGLDVNTPANASGLNAFYDKPTNSIPAVISLADFAANQSQGILLLHHHNVPGKKTEVINVVDSCSLQVGDTSVVNRPDNDSNCGSVSYAVNRANNGVGASQTISFTGPSNTYTLTAPIALNAANKTIILDGGCAAGSNGTKLVANGLTNAIQLSTSGHTVKGFDIRGATGYAIDVQGNDNKLLCNVITGNGGGIKLGTIGGASAGTNMLGMLGDATSANVIYANAGYGILVSNGSKNYANYNLVGFNKAGAPSKNTAGGLKVEGGSLYLEQGNRFNAS